MKSLWLSELRVASGLATQTTCHRQGLKGLAAPGHCLWRSADKAWSAQCGGALRPLAESAGAVHQPHAVPPAALGFVECGVTLFDQGR